MPAGSTRTGGETRYLLVADGSADSAAAAWVAAWLAADPRAEVVVALVLAPVRAYGVRLPSGEWFEPDVPLDVAAERSGLMALRPALAALEAAAPGRVRAEVRLGSPAEEILWAAAEWGVRAIVVDGARTASWRRLVRPPLAEVLQRRAPCEVVVVAGPAAPAAAA